MEILMTVDNVGDFLAHHGVKGMKWGKWNAETAARYNGAKDDFKGGGGGDDEEEEDVDDRPEKFLREGKIDALTARRMRSQMDGLIRDLEDGKITEAAYMQRMNAVYERNKLKPTYSSSHISAASDRDRVYEATGKSTHNTSRAELNAIVKQNARTSAKSMVEARKSGSGYSVVNAIVNKTAGTAGDAAAVNRASDWKAKHVGHHA